MKKLIITLSLFFFLLPRISYAETLSCSQMWDDKIYSFYYTREGNQFVDGGVSRLDIILDNKTTLILQNVHLEATYIFLFDKKSKKFVAYFISISEKNKDGDEGSCIVID